MLSKKEDEAVLKTIKWDSVKLVNKWGRDNYGLSITIFNTVKPFISRA